MDWKVGEAWAKWISVLDWDGLLSGIFYLLGSCQYAKLRKTAFDLLLYSIQPVSEEKVTCVCLCSTSVWIYTCSGDVFGVSETEKNNPKPSFPSINLAKNAKKNT